MKQVVAVLFALIAAVPAAAQRHVDLVIDVEGVRRSNSFEFEPNSVRYEPVFANGGGVGAAINWYFSSRVSVETKAAVLD